MAKKAVKKAAPKKSAARKGKRTYETTVAGGTYWKPSKKGDSVEGELVRIDERPNNLGKKGEVQKTVVLKNEKGDEMFMPSHWQIVATAEKYGEGFYKITCTQMSVKGKGKAKATPYKYDIGFAEA